MKKLFTLILTLMLAVTPFVFSSDAVFAEESEAVSVIRANFKSGEISDDFSLGGEYNLSGGLILNGGFIRTEKKGRYFLLYTEVYSETGIAVTFGESELVIDFKESRIVFGEKIASFGKKKYGGDSVLIRVESIGEILTVGIKTSYETLDVIYKNVASFDYGAQYGKIGLKSFGGAAEVYTFKLFPYDSDFVPEHHDYDEAEDAVPERVKKPVRNPKGNKAVIIIAANGAVAAAAIAVITVFAVKKAKRRKSGDENV